MAKAKKAEPRVVEAENKMYELMLVLKPDLLESAVTKKLKEFSKFLKDGECDVKLEDIWGKRKLAYRIKQFEEGIYVVYNLIAPTTFIAELDNHLRIDNEVIRHLLVSIDNDYKYSKFDEEVEEAPKEEKKPVKKEEKKVIKEEPKPAEGGEQAEPAEEKEKEEVKEEKEEKKAEKEEVVEEKEKEIIEEKKEEEKEKKKEEEEPKKEKPKASTAADKKKKVEKKEEEKEEKKEEKTGLLSKIFSKSKDKEEEKEDKKKDEIDRSALDSKLDDLLSGDDLNI